MISFYFSCGKINFVERLKGYNMKNLKLIILTGIITLGLGFFTGSAVNSSQAPVVKPTATVQKTVNIQESLYAPTSSLDIVTNPTKYLNKKVKIRAKFDKFSTLGLDYKPAYRSSEKYISFLIKRDDVINHTVPLSEMKNFLERDTAEKYIDLKPGDEIEYYGVVFSDALGDAWISVDKFTVLNQQKDAPKK
jgi:hypothetical protein